MQDFDERQAHREVEHLHQLAMDAYREGQYATAERLLEHAVSVAQRLDDLSLQIKVRHMLAVMQQMRGKDVQAIATYTWMIGIATGPIYHEHLTNLETLNHLAEAFIGFVMGGSFLPEMPFERLLHVIDDGLYWLERVGKAQWAAGLRLLKGRLLKKQGDLQAARVELEAALALRRRHLDAPGLTLADHLLDLAEVLYDSTINAYEEAIILAKEALTGNESIGSIAHTRNRAYEALAYAYLGMGEYEAALSAAQECLVQAQAMESSEAAVAAYQLLGRLYREVGRLDEAAHATVQEWRWARRDGSVEYRNLALTDCARVRNLQARAACGLPASWDALPQQVPVQVNRALALKHVKSVRRLLRWATPLATQLDRATGRRVYQEALDWQLQRAEEVEVWLRKGGEHEG